MRWSRLVLDENMSACPLAVEGPESPSSSSSGSVEAEELWRE